jgi:hypothetical protein
MKENETERTRGVGASNPCREGNGETITTMEPKLQKGIIVEKSGTG